MGSSSIEPNIRNASKKSYNSGNIKVNDSLLQTTHKHLTVPSGTQVRCLILPIFTSTLSMMSDAYRCEHGKLSK
jgi:hypothetical protein